MTQEEQNLYFAEKIIIEEQAYSRGYEDAKKEFERPHGEWIDHSDEGYVECPFCEHATTCDDNIEELHYCFFCGASMISSNSEIEKSKSEIVPDYRDGWRLKEGGENG